MLRASGGGGRSEANPPSSSPPSSSSPPPQTLREMQRAVVAAGPEDAASALAFVQASDTFCFYTPARGRRRVHTGQPVKKCAMSLVQALRATKAALRAAAADASADADALARTLIGGNPLPEAGARDVTWRARIGSLHNEEVTVIYIRTGNNNLLTRARARAQPAL